MAVPYRPPRFPLYGSHKTHKFDEILLGDSPQDNGTALVKTNVTQVVVPTSVHLWRVILRPPI